MTSKSESQLMTEIATELDTLYAKFSDSDVSIVADLLIALSDNIGTPTLADFTADLVALDTQADLVLAQNP